MSVIIGKGILESLTWVDPKKGPGGVALPAPGENVPLSPGGLIFRQESIKALLRTLSARDPYTGQHSNRVTNIALDFSRSLKLPSQDLEAVTNAGYLHDIGKIGISDAILLKPGPLTPDERAAIETHPLIGEKIVEPLGFGSRERDLILLHHERWDGQGYPHGLEEGKIPVLCRVLALADVFDAMTSDRPYRRAFTVPEALFEIESQAGRQFDPDLAKKFVQMVGSRDAQTLFRIPPPPWLGGEW